MMQRNWLAVSKLTRRFWRILPRALESLKNLHFNCLLLTRVYNVWVKKVRRSCVIILKNDAKFVEELACHFKIDIRNFYEFWLEHSKVWKICTLMGCFWPKYIIFEQKKYRGVMFDGTEHWYNIWRKTGFSFQKWHEKFYKFSQVEKKYFILESKIVELNQNKSSKQIDQKFLKKLSRWVFFFNVQYKYFKDMMAAYEKLI